MLRLMTYNVHRCLGTDGRLSPERIAEVIASSTCDVVALQELDVMRARTAGVDQPTHLAELLGMRHLFCATVVHDDERYGIALLARGDLHLHRAAPLSTTPRREPRSAQWATLEHDGQPLHVVNTHLSLDRGERSLQVAALLGADWLEGRADGAPLVLCGDFNAVPSSRVYRHITQRFGDAQRMTLRRGTHATFPARWPLLRIDHVFVSAGLEVLDTEVVETVLSRRASDHLPLVVTLRLGERPPMASRS